MPRAPLSAYVDAGRLAAAAHQSDDTTVVVVPEGGTSFEPEKKGIIYSYRNGDLRRTHPLPMIPAPINPSDAGVAGVAMMTAQRAERARAGRVRPTSGFSHKLQDGDEGAQSAAFWLTKKSSESRNDAQLGLWGGIAAEGQGGSHH
jgi:hypothetical protein